MNGPVPSLLEKQNALNRSTRGQWALYASHRRQIERLLVPRRPGGRICVLGAGNCNDLDLRWLAEVYADVCLVDLDAEALQRAVAFQRVQDVSHIRRCAPIDLTGIAGAIADWPTKEPSQEQVTKALHAARLPTAQLIKTWGGPFDTVLSPCVLSQMIAPIRDVLGESHPRFLPILAAVRSRHLRLMLDLASNDAQGIFVCDVLSSRSIKDLARVPEKELPGLLRDRSSAGRSFTGLDPDSIAGMLKRDPELAPRVAAIGHVSPWLWHLSLQRTFLVYAMTFKKRSGGEGACLRDPSLLDAGAAGVFESRNAQF